MSIIFYPSSPCFDRHNAREVFSSFTFAAVASCWCQKEHHRALNRQEHVSRGDASTDVNGGRFSVKMDHKIRSEWRNPENLGTSNCAQAVFGVCLLSYRHVRARMEMKMLGSQSLPVASLIDPQRPLQQNTKRSFPQKYPVQIQRPLNIQ